MKRYYLGLNSDGPRAIRCLFCRGRSRDLRDLVQFLTGKYQGASILTKNGRSALLIALKSYFEPGDKIIVNAFTCYAVYEAVKAAGMVPVFADIDAENLNFNVDTLKKVCEGAKGIIVQNSLGNLVDIAEIEEFADKNGLLIIEDLAHVVKEKYPDGREVGTVGVATAFSFGKDKAINTISGGAVVLRAPVKHEIKAPLKLPKLSDHLRARFYPFFCATCRGLNHIHVGGVLMRGLIKIHWVEKSADNKLSSKRRLSKFQARLALKEFKKSSSKLRDFYLVENREEVLAKLREAGYFFDGFWYEKPVSPERYYKKVKFPEESCPTALDVTEKIINFPTYYKKSDLKKAYEIIEPYLIGGKNG